MEARLSTCRRFDVGKGTYARGGVGVGLKQQLWGGGQLCLRACVCEGMWRCWVRSCWWFTCPPAACPQRQGCPPALMVMSQRAAHRGTSH